MVPRPISLVPSHVFQHFHAKKKKKNWENFSHKNITLKNTGRRKQMCSLEISSHASCEYPSIGYTCSNRAMLSLKHDCVHIIFSCSSWSLPPQSGGGMFLSDGHSQH